MAKKVDKLGSAKRFGARYGSKTKHKFAQVEKEQRRKHKCPYCNVIAVKRIAVGIWHCRKCDAKFTGKAYTVSKPIIVSETNEPESKVQEDMPEETEETEQLEMEKAEELKAEKVEEGA
jgi:large subunit ribosomal protein L37Ae|tara:strand:- start:273 stop:629 length:357 start_codon:yes stop_codon:yes gene_type:complete